jgi:hypothetical protein
MTAKLCPGGFCEIQVIDCRRERREGGPEDVPRHEERLQREDRRIALSMTIAD